MFTKAGLLIAVALVLLGYRWGKAKNAPQKPAPAQVVLQPAKPRKEILPIKLLLLIVIILLIVAIFTSLQR